MKNGFHVSPSIACEYLIADKMCATGQYFENIGDDVDPDKISILGEKIPPVLFIQQNIADFFAFDQLQEIMLFSKKIKEMLTIL